jgi:uncharacterized protein (DUF58 family)
VEEWFDLLPSWAAFVIACILIGWAILWFFLPFFVYLIHANLIGLRKDLARLERRGERVTTPPGS